MNSLAAYRLYRGFSQSELADKVGCTQAEISWYETGKRKPRKERIKKLAKALCVKEIILCL